MRGTDRPRNRLQRPDCAQAGTADVLGSHPGLRAGARSEVGGYRRVELSARECGKCDVQTPRRHWRSEFDRGQGDHKAYSEKPPVEAAFQRSAQVDASKICVEAHGSEVTLRGQVRSWTERDQAQATAWFAPGVHCVNNEIVVKPDREFTFTPARSRAEPDPMSN